MDNGLAKAIQNAYTAGCDYLETLAHLGKLGHNHPIGISDQEKVDVAYHQLNNAQIDLSTALDAATKYW